MPLHPLESRIKSLEQGVTQLEQLPARIDALASQVSLLRTAMPLNFCRAQRWPWAGSSTLPSPARGSPLDPRRTGC